MSNVADKLLCLTTVVNVRHTEFSKISVRGLGADRYYATDTNRQDLHLTRVLTL